MSFMDLEKACDRVSRKALWQVLRKYDVHGKLLNGIKSIYPNIQACVSPRILWIKFKFSSVKVCVVVGYGPNVKGEERDRFWNDMDRTLDNIGNGYRLYILGDLNG